MFVCVYCLWKVHLNRTSRCVAATHVLSEIRIMVSIRTRWSRAHPHCQLPFDTRSMWIIKCGPPKTNNRRNHRTTIAYLKQPAGSIYGLNLGARDVNLISICYHQIRSVRVANTVEYTSRSRIDLEWAHSSSVYRRVECRVWRVWTRFASNHNVAHFVLRSKTLWVLEANSRFEWHQWCSAVIPTNVSCL